MNYAIKVQEAITSAKAKSEVNFDIRVGIAYGDAYEFVVHEGQIDFIGRAVDEAARLCGAAGEKAIFVDAETTINARLTSVSSSKGRSQLPPRKASEYIGQVQKIILRGLGEVNYYELLWDDARFNVSKEFVSGLSPSTQSVSMDQIGGARPTESLPPGRLEIGSVLSWKENFGFVQSAEGENHYVNPRAIVNSDVLPEVGSVAFVSLPAREEGRAKMASCCIIIDSKTKGIIKFVNEEKEFGFVTVQDDFGGTADIWFSTRDNSINSSANGKPASFTVISRGRSPAATEIEVD